MKVEYRPVRFVKKRRYDGRVAIGPYVERVFVKDTQNVAVKRPSAANIEAQADREDSRPYLSSSDIIKHAGKDQRFYPVGTGCRICRGCSTRRSYWIVNKIECLKRVDRCMRLISLTGEYKHDDQTLLEIVDVPRGYYTGPSQ